MLYFSHGHTTKITTIYRTTIFFIFLFFRTTIDEDDLKTNKKYFLKVKKKKGTRMSWVGGAEMQYNQDPHPGVGDP